MFPQGGWSIGRLAGVEIKLNLSLLFIAFFVSYTLAGFILPHSVPGLSPSLYWLTGLMASVMFIGSILWHEMAHVLVALRYGIPVVQIVLHLFGGVAQIAREPERPSQEFNIAIAGPLSSAFLWLFFGALSPLKGLAGAVCAWLSVVNLTLALFNLLPGFPLDGGRVLRSILWQVSKSYRLATRQASRVGQGMAGLFALVGFVFMLNGAAFNGIWFLLIALFLYMAASASYRMARGASLPMQTQVRRVMRFNVPTVESGLPLALLAWRYLDHARDQAFPVIDNGLLVGLVSAVEVDKFPRLEWGKIRVGQVMLPRDRLCIVSPDDDIQSALTAFETTGTNHAPVFDGGGFIGMLNRRDIVYRT